MARLRREGKGHIPLDETFEPWAFIDGVDENRSPIFRDMARHARVMVARMFARREIRGATPTHMYRGGRPDDPDHAEGYAWVSLPDRSAVIVGHARIRSYWFPAVLDFDLADDLAHLDLAARLMRYSEGDPSVLQDAATVPVFGRGWSGGGADRSTSPPPDVGSLPYRLGRSLGTGGYAQVFEAVPRAGAGPTVALKRGLRDTKEGIARLKREIQVQQALAHPNVMPVLDADIAEGWYTMPLAARQPPPAARGRRAGRSR